MKYLMVHVLDIITAAWSTPAQSKPCYGGTTNSRRKKGKRLPPYAFLLAFLWLALSTLDVQAQEFDQVTRVDSDNELYQQRLVKDEADNLYLVGSFRGTADFDTGPLTSVAWTDIYFAKYDAAGNNLWARRVGGSGNDTSEGIAIDSGGNVYVTGMFEESITVGPVHLPDTNTEVDSFIAKYDTNGNFLWVKQIGGTNGNVLATATAVDDSGNVYVGGYFAAAVYFNDITLNTTGDYDSFLAKYDSNGNFLWVQQITGAALQQEQGIAVYGDRIYITGYFHDDVTFGATSLTTTGSLDIFLAAYESSGALAWARRAGSTTPDDVHDIGVDSNGNVFITGFIGGTASFGAIAVNGSGYLAKYDSTGTPLWVQPFSGPGEPWGYRLGIDEANNVYATGLTGNGQATFGSLTIIGQSFSIFIVSYDNNGNTLWVRQADTPAILIPKGIVINSNNYVYVAGEYDSEVYLGSFTLRDGEAFIARIAPTPSNDLIFADGFETGTLSAWTNYSSDSGDLRADANAALVGTRGLLALLDDNTPIGTRDELPDGEDRYQVRFRLTPNNLVMAQDENHVIFFGYSGSDLTRPVLRLELRYHSGSYQLRAALFNDGTVWRTGNWKEISNFHNRIELNWYSATGNSTNDGNLRLWINGGLASVVNGVDNDTRRIDTIRLGAIAGIDDGTRGTNYFDVFESRRLTYVDPDVMVAAALPDEVTAWTEVDESEPEEAALMQEVLEYAEQVEREEAGEETPPTEEDQTPHIFLPFVNSD